MGSSNKSLKKTLVTSLEDCGLLEGQMELVRKYLFEEADTCKLSLEAREDFWDKHKIDRKREIVRRFEQMAKHEEDELIRRYFEVTFQIFGTSMYPIVAVGYVRHLLPKAKRVALEARRYGTDPKYDAYRMHHNTLLDITEDRDELKAALGYTDGKSFQAELGILAAMFYDGETAKPWNGKGVSDGFETNEYVKKYPKEFERYEKLFPQIIGSVYSKDLSVQELEVLRDYICKKAVHMPVTKEVFAITAKTELYGPHAKYIIWKAVMNYRLSPMLYGFLKVCMGGGHLGQTMDIMLATGCKLDLDQEIRRWYVDFTPDDAEFIKWLGKSWYARECSGYIKEEAQLHLNKLLVEMAQKCPGAYLEALKSAEDDVYENITNVLRTELNPEIFQEKFSAFLDQGKLEEQEKVRKQLVMELEPELAVLSEAYLRGEKPVDELCAYDMPMSIVECNDSFERVSFYHAVYGEDAFFARCITFLVVRECENPLYRFSCMISGNAIKHSEEERVSEDSIKGLFFCMKHGGLNIAYLLRTSEEIYDGFWGNKDELRRTLEEIFAGYLKEAEQETLEAFHDASILGRQMGIRVLGKQAERYQAALYTYLGETSKQVKEELLAVLAGQEEGAEALMRVLETSKKPTEREMAATILGKYKVVTDYRDRLAAVLQREKNRKAADVLREVIQNIDALEGVTVDAEWMVYIKECHRGGKKRTLAWAYGVPLPEVHIATNCEQAHVDKTQAIDGTRTVAGEEYMQAILLAYAGMASPGWNRDVHILTDRLDKTDLAAYMEAIYDQWLVFGAEANKKWVLYAAAIHGGSRIVPRLQRHINEWAASSRGAIAAEAVRALSLNDSPTALLTVDGIARKYKFKQVQKAARDALQFAATQYGLTVEELADQIVPDLGFDEHMERQFDYGARSFTVRISSTLDIEVTDENGKKRKTLPAVGKQDDAVKAAAALAEFKELKKQMKAVVKNQALRLEWALSLDRRWTVENWKRLFVKNPVMHLFALGLIWGYYEDGELRQTFRYMEDGTFNTAEEEEFGFSGDGMVGLMHPIDMRAEDIAAWKGQLADYEAKQPVEQLERPIYRVLEEEKGKKHLMRFDGKMVKGLSLAGKLTEQGWSRGTPRDAGDYAEFYRRDTDARLSVELRFSGAFIGDGDEDITVYDASFYRYEDMDKRDWKYDMDVDDKALELDQVPPRYFSEVINQLTKAIKYSTKLA